eukprot:2108422-Rhodomonas_salina.1
MAVPFTSTHKPHIAPTHALAPLPPSIRADRSHQPACISHARASQRTHGDTDRPEVSDGALKLVEGRA